MKDIKTELYPSRSADAPLIILNTFEGEGQKVYLEICKISDADFSLCAIGGLNWNADISPWAEEAIYKDDEPFSGKADEYLTLLTENIIPKAIKELGKNPSYIAITGYSLAGLFALYSLYKCDIFSKAASASGSFWYPKFTDFAKSNEFKRKPDLLYFSIGDKEANTKNEKMKRVLVNTQELNEYYKQKGFSSVFELNPGNHFKESDKRMAKAIKYILEN